MPPGLKDSWQEGKRRSCPRSTDGEDLGGAKILGSREFENGQAGSLLLEAMIKLWRPRPLSGLQQGLCFSSLKTETNKQTNKLESGEMTHGLRALPALLKIPNSIPGTRVRRLTGGAVTRVSAGTCRHMHTIKSCRGLCSHLCQQSNNSRWARR